jgi:hypothetical protein
MKLQINLSKTFTSPATTPSQRQIADVVKEVPHKYMDEVEMARGYQ